MKLYQKLSLLITPLVVIPVLIVASLTRSHLIEETQKTYSIQATSVVLQVARQIENHIDSAKTNIRLLANQQLVKQFILDEKSSRHTILLPNLLSIFQNIQKTIPDYYEIEILNTEGSELARFNHQDSLSTRKNNDEQYFKQIKQSDSDLNTQLIFDNNRDQYALLISLRLKLKHPVYDNYKDEAKTRGYLMIKMDLTFARQQINEFDIGSAGGLLLLNKDKQVIFATAHVTDQGILSQLNSYQMPLFNKANSNTNKKTIVSRFKEHNLRIFSYPLEGNIYLLGLLFEDDILAISNKISIQVILISLMVMLFILVLIFYVLDRVIIAPLDTLNIATESFSKSKQVVDVKIDSHDEIGNLATSFSHMTLNISATLEKLNQARKTAEQANKAKSNFLASMSHEIRTPLNGIVGISQLLFHQNLNSQQTEMLTRLRKSAELLQHLVNDILDLAKIESGNLEIEHIHFSMHTIIDKCLIAFEHQAQAKGLKIVSSISPSMPTQLVGDELRISQILINFMANALKFTETGSIKIVVEEQHRSATEIILSVSVTDTGIGMDKKTQLTIFSNFTQADNSISRQYGGSGLGLSICKQLVELMNGSIMVESEIGKGSTFNCKIPLKIGSEKAFDQAIIHPSQSHKGLRVLVVDDEEINLFLAIGLLETEGIIVTTAESGQQALDLAKQEIFDLVLMDIHMPNLNGWETTRLFRSSALPQLSQIPIIGLTADVFKESRERCFDSGMNLVISKPFEFSDLLQQMDSLLDLT